MSRLNKPETIGICKKGEEGRGKGPFKMHCLSACKICKLNISHSKVFIIQYRCFSSSPGAADFVPFVWRTG